MSAPSQRARRTRLSLVGLVAALAFVELILHRIFARLIHLEPLRPRSSGVRVLDGLSLFSLQLLAVLSALVLALAIVRVVAFGRRWRSGARVSLGLVGFVCVSLATLGVVVRLPPSLHFHLLLSFGFFGLLLLLAVLASGERARTKLGALVVFVPIAMHVVASLQARLHPGLPRGGELTTWAERAGIAAALLAWPLFAPGGPLPRAAVGLAVLAAAGAATLLRLDWETAARVAAYGFGVDLPLHPYAWPLYALALGVLVLIVATLLSRPGLHRLRGYGLALLTLGGLQPSLAYQLTLSALGMFCLAEAALRSTSPGLPRAAFEALVRGVAAALGTTHVTITGPEGWEVARVQAPPSEGAPVSILLARRAASVRGLELVVGETPPRDPPFTLERRGVPRLGPRAEGPRVETSDAHFDTTFRIHDRRGSGAALLDDETRGRFDRQVQGWLGVWPQRGVCYRAIELPSADQALPDLIALLRDVAARTA